MKWIRYDADGATHFGILEGDQVVPRLSVEHEPGLFGMGSGSSFFLSVLGLKRK